MEVKIEAVAGDVQDEAEKQFSKIIDFFAISDKKGVVFLSYP
jgi:hypothetical protein